MGVQRLDPVRGKGLGQVGVQLGGQVGQLRHRRGLRALGDQAPSSRPRASTASQPPPIAPPPRPRIAPAIRIACSAGVVQAVDRAACETASAVAAASPTPAPRRTAAAPAPSRHAQQVLAGEADERPAQIAQLIQAAQQLEAVGDPQVEVDPRIDRELLVADPVGDRGLDPLGEPVAEVIDRILEPRSRPVLAGVPSMCIRTRPQPLTASSSNSTGSSAPLISLIATPAAALLPRPRPRRCRRRSGPSAQRGHLDGGRQPRGLFQRAEPEVRCVRGRPRRRACRTPSSSSRTPSATACSGVPLRAPAYESVVTLTMPTASGRSSSERAVGELPGGHPRLR